ncbi:hypothetical protein GNF78_16010, partial [Clostridium perfringens]
MEVENQLRVKRSGQGWSWIDLEVKEDEWDSPKVRRLRQNSPLTREWLDALPKMESNQLSVRFPDGREPILYGSLFYSVQEEIKDTQADCLLAHFFVSADVLVTINFDANTTRVMNQKDNEIMLLDCLRPVDGLFVLTRVILRYFRV